MGYSQPSIGRRVDADSLDIYHDQTTRLLRLKKESASTISMRGGYGTGNDFQWYANITDAYPKITMAGGANIILTTSGGGSIIQFDTANVKFGTYTAKGAEAFDGYIDILDNLGNARKIMTCA